MIYKLYDFLKKSLLRRVINKNKTKIQIANNSIITGNSHIILRSPKEDRFYLEIGEMSLIECDFFVENEFGKITLGDRVHIGGNTKIISVNSVKIGSDVTIAWGCTIYDHNSHSIYWNYRKNDTLQEISDLKNTGDFVKNKNWENVDSRPIIVEDKVWIGFNVTILKGVKIGEGAVIGACSVVTKDVLPYTIVAGNPAKVVKKISDNNLETH